jgi:hypothetical protein
MWAKAERNGGTSQKSTREGNVTRDRNRTRREVATPEGDGLRQSWGKGEIKIKDISKTSRGGKYALLHSARSCHQARRAASTDSVRMQV